MTKKDLPLIYSVGLITDAKYEIPTTDTGVLIIHMTNNRYHNNIQIIISS